MEKKRVIKNLEKLDLNLRSQLKKEYPDGFEDDLLKLTSAKNEPFYVVPLETDDTHYLVKIAVKRNSDGEMDVDLESEEIKDFDSEFDGDGDDDDQPAYRDDAEEDEDADSQD